MRYKAMFFAGLVAGFVAGTRAGRERYDQMVRLTRQVAESPPVQKATATVTAKTSELAKTAAVKAPELAKTAAVKAPELAKTAMPKIVDTARSAADRLPFAGKADGAGTEAPSGRADGGRMTYQADGSPASANGTRMD